jgi:hypothetical protein
MELHQEYQHHCVLNVQIVVGIAYTHSAVAVAGWLADHVADTALVGITHRSTDAADLKFL